MALFISVLSFIRIVLFSTSVSVGIVAHPPAPEYYCAPINSKNILNFEYLFAQSEGAVNEYLVSKLLTKYVYRR